MADKKADSEILNRIKSRIVQKYRPEKIILFGSAVEGKMHDNSDLDIAIIKDTDKRFYDRIGDVLKILRPITPKPPIDIIVYTPSEYSRMTNESYFVKDEITKKGNILYQQKV